MEFDSWLLEKVDQRLHSLEGLSSFELSTKALLYCAVPFSLVFHLNISLSAYSKIGNYFVISSGNNVNHVGDLSTLIEQYKVEMDCHKSIKGELVGRSVGKSIGEIGSNEYFLQVGGLLQKDTVVEHEVYHICSGHLDQIDPLGLKYSFWFEPRTVFYSLMGI